jgi:hypothetical protein
MPPDQFQNKEQILFSNVYDAVWTVRFHLQTHNSDTIELWSIVAETRLILFTDMFNVSITTERQG